MNREEEGGARRAGRRDTWRKQGEEEGVGWRGGLFFFTVALLPSTVLCHCNAPPLLSLFKSFYNNNNTNNNHKNAKKYIYKPQPWLTTLSPQKGGEAWPSSSSESVTNRDAEEKRNGKEGQRSEKEKERASKGGGGGTHTHKHSVGRMCSNEEEINRKEEVAMKRGGCRDQQ